MEVELVGNNSRLLLLWCPFLLRVAVFSPVNWLKWCSCSVWPSSLRLSPVCEGPGLIWGRWGGKFDAGLGLVQLLQFLRRVGVGGVVEVVVGLGRVLAHLPLLLLLLLTWHNSLSSPGSHLTTLTRRHLKSEQKSGKGETNHGILLGCPSPYFYFHKNIICYILYDVIWWMCFLIFQRHTWECLSKLSIVWWLFGLWWHLFVFCLPRAWPGSLYIYYWITLSSLSWKNYNISSVRRIIKVMNGPNTSLEKDGCRVPVLSPLHKLILASKVRRGGISGSCVS